MILSALLTSVGINLGLCVIYIALFSILRKLPVNADVYAPRIVSETINLHRSDSNLKKLLPSSSWVRMAWDPSEEVLLERAGLDGVVFIRIFVFSLKVFSFAGVVGLCILLPINYMGNQLYIDFSDFANKSLESFSISNVNDGSKKLWIHFGAMYAFTVFVFYLLYEEYKYIASKRLAFYASSEPKTNEFTVLVRGIPKSSTESLSETVEKFFSECYPSLYLSHYMVYNTSKIWKLLGKAEDIYTKIAHLKSSKKSSERYGRVGFLGICGPTVDLVEYYEGKLEDLEDKVRTQQSLLSGKELCAAFVSFKSRIGAAISLNIQQGQNPTEWLTEPAPEARDIYWAFFSTSFLTRWIGNVVVILAFVVLTVLFFIPVILVQGLTNLNTLEALFPFLKGILDLTLISAIITGYLPSLILKTFLLIAPPVMRLLSSIQSFISHSQIERSACIKVLVFTIWNVFFANALSGSVLYRINVFLEPTEIPNILAVAVPEQATFFITYVVTSGWTNTSSELLRLTTLILNSLRRIFTNEKVEDFKVPSLHYSSQIPNILLFGLIGITYFFLSPLILPFLLIYFCLGYITYRHQLLYVYAPNFETGGQFWPIVHNSTIFSLILMHLIAVGIFGLKHLGLASTLTIPLPLITLLFNSYCRKRFLPIFMGYPVQVMTKKDKRDENDRAISKFREQLITAYQDPALKPIEFSSRTNSRSVPLLSSIT